MTLKREEITDRKKSKREEEKIHYESLKIKKWLVKKLTLKRITHVKDHSRTPKKKRRTLRAG
jgi:hypothetical protein